jgi:anti-anti-sigma factor
VSHALPLRYPSAGDLPAAGSAPLTDFGVAASATSGQVVVAVRGEIDAAAVLMVDSIFDMAITLGTSPVTVDLSDVDDTAVAGLVVIAAAVRRFASWGGQLTLRSSLHVAGQLSTMVGPAPWIRFEPPATDRPRPSSTTPGRTRDSGLGTFGPTRSTDRVAH